MENCYSTSVLKNGSEFSRSISTHPSRRPTLTDERLNWLRLQEERCVSRMEAVLDESGARLAILSRRGSNLNKYRFDTEVPHYTHMAFAVKAEGSWYLDHLLNTHGGAEGHLYRQQLSDFFCDDPFEYHFGVIVPSAELQERIINTLRSPVREKLHIKRYSCVAYPFSTRFQSSNQWLAEIIGAAQSAATNRPDSQDYLRQRDLQPTIMRLNMFKQAAAPVVTRNTRMTDQPIRLRASGRIGFVMEPSIRSYIERTDCISLNCRIALDDESDTPTPFKQPLRCAA